MPELPEVETIVRSLRHRVEGRSIRSAKLLWARSLATPDFKHFEKRVCACKISKLSRLGKYLVFALIPQSKSSENLAEFLLLHLRMSGSLRVVKSSSKLLPHDRAVLSFENKTDLRFNDIRKFGRLYLVKDLKQVTHKLGPDLIHATPSAQEFYAALNSKKAGLKSLLLNQSFFAGLGNIYVDESLWLARLHPLTRSDRITKDQAEILLAAILRVLQNAIRMNGTDAGDGVVDFGRNKPKVYGRAGGNCPRCKTKILRLVVGQRGTHLCPKCQKKSRASARRSR